MIAGESIYVILAEVFETVSKVVKTDYLSALAILTNDGGSWRTCRLRHARQSMTAGEWSIQHVAGEFMVADIGTKALTSVRLEFLKTLMGMGKYEGKESEADRPPKEKEADRPQKKRRLTDHQKKRRLTDHQKDQEADRPPKERRLIDHQKIRRLTDHQKKRRLIDPQKKEG